MVPRRVYDVVKKSDAFTSVGCLAQIVKVRTSSLQFIDIRTRQQYRF